MNNKLAKNEKLNNKASVTVFHFNFAHECQTIILADS